MIKKKKKNVPSRSCTSSVLSGCSSSVGHECGERVNMVRWNTKIAPRVPTAIMTRKLARLLRRRRHLFPLQNTWEREINDRINWTSKVILTLLYFWSGCHMCNISWRKTDKTGKSQKYIQFWYIYICVCVCVCIGGVIICIVFRGAGDCGDVEIICSTPPQLSTSLNW